MDLPNIAKVVGALASMFPIAAALALILGAVWVLYTKIIRLAIQHSHEHAQKWVATVLEAIRGGKGGP